MRALVTAGNTREKIDSVRDWGNIFTGNTGYSIARALADVAEVDLLTSNQNHLRELGTPAAQATKHPIHASGFSSHGELKGALTALMARHRYDGVFMTAAVADYRPDGAFAVIERTPTLVPGEERWLVRDVHAAKVKSSHPQIAFLGRQSEKLIDLFRTTWKHEGLLVKFKLEVGIDQAELIRVGQFSRRHSGAEYLVANTLDMVEGPNAGAFLLSDSGEEWVPRDRLPSRLARLLETHS